MKAAVHTVLTLGLLGVGSVLHTSTADALSISYEQLGGANPRTGSGAVTDYNNLPAHDSLGVHVAASPVISGASPYTFYDDFIISVPNNTLDALAASITLGDSSISNLQVRLFSFSTNPTLPVIPGPPNQPFVEGWSQAINFPGGEIDQSVIFPTPPALVTQGKWVLEVRGVAGSNGGDYTLGLNLNPVPLPAALPLLLTGLGLTGGVVARRRRA